MVVSSLPLLALLLYLCCCRFLQSINGWLQST